MRNTNKVIINTNCSDYMKCIDNALQIDLIYKTEKIKIQGYDTYISYVRFKKNVNNKGEFIDFKDMVPVILPDKDILNNKYPELLYHMFNFKDPENKKKYTLNQIITALGIITYGKDYNYIDNIYCILDYYTSKLEDIKLKENKYLINVKRIEVIDVFNMCINNSCVLSPYEDKKQNNTNIGYIMINCNGRIPYHRLKTILLCKQPLYLYNGNKLFSTHINIHDGSVLNSVNHIDENKLNNSIKNLEFLTYGQNTSYSSNSNKFYYTFENIYTKNCFKFTTIKELDDWVYLSHLLGKNTNIYDICNTIYQMLKGRIKSNHFSVKQQFNDCVISTNVPEIDNTGIQEIDSKKCHWEIYNDKTKLNKKCKSIKERDLYIAKLTGWNEIASKCTKNCLTPNSVGRYCRNILSGDIPNIGGYIYVKKVEPAPLLWG